MWDIVLPDDVVSIRSDLLLVDHDGSTMQAIFPKAVTRWFTGKIVEGCVYKFTRFDTVNCRLSYLAIPSDYIIYFNSSTVVEEISESIKFDYPRYFFRFAVMEDLRARNEKNVVGMLTIIGSKTSVDRASGNSSMDRRDVMIKLLRFGILYMRIIGLHVSSIDEEFLMSRPSNPVMVITGGIVKEYNSVKYISSSSATKIYIDIDIPETGQLKQKFDGIIPPVRLLTADESKSIGPVAKPIDMISGIMFCQGQRYRIQARIVEMDIANGWFYESCPKCRVKLMPENGKFTCNDDGIVTPEFVDSLFFFDSMQLKLIIEDDTARIEVVVFGKQAEELVGLPLTKTVANQCLDKTKLPAMARDPTKSEVDYVFVIGVTEQTYKRGLKKFKVYSYNAKEKNNEPVVLDKGKKVVNYSGREVMEIGASDKGRVKEDNIGVVSADYNESMIAPDAVSTPQLSRNINSGKRR
ncbi:Nucleic acid-binding protein [Corchorus olitorius]|uniref:Nucleic acid-binding protein n=1 Tax=Corchorus olitorius TaxID=93759 RepID=A0A1R3KMH8_9ROSI|nr:Nucleic acid-binding protein [Corchorus olitorius]